MTPRRYAQNIPFAWYVSIIDAEIYVFSALTKSFVAYCNTRLHIIVAMKNTKRVYEMREYDDLIAPYSLRSYSSLHVTMDRICLHMVSSKRKNFNVCTFYILHCTEHVYCFLLITNNKSIIPIPLVCIFYHLNSFPSIFFGKWGNCSKN